MALTIMVSSGERLTSTPSMFITRVMKASQSNLACKKVQINIAFDLIHIVLISVKTIWLWNDMTRSKSNTAVTCI